MAPRNPRALIVLLLLFVAAGAVLALNPQASSPPLFPTATEEAK